MSDLETKLRERISLSYARAGASTFDVFTSEAHDLVRIALEHAAEIADRDNEDDPFDVGWAIRVAAHALTTAIEAVRP